MNTQAALTVITNPSPAITGVVDWRWQPERTGDYGRDCEAGRAIADEIALKIERAGSPLPLNTLARMIVQAGEWGAVEIGLFTQLGSHLAA